MRVSQDPCFRYVCQWYIIVQTRIVIIILSTNYTYIRKFSTFQDHVLIFSFILCVGVLRERGEVAEEVWTFFLSLQNMRAAGAVNVEADSLKLKPEPTGTTFTLKRI